MTDLTEIRFLLTMVDFGGHGASCWSRRGVENSLRFVGDRASAGRAEHANIVPSDIGILMFRPLESRSHVGLLRAQDTPDPVRTKVFENWKLAARRIFIDVTGAALSSCEKI